MFSPFFMLQKMENYGALQTFLFKISEMFLKFSKPNGLFMINFILSFAYLFGQTGGSSRLPQDSEKSRDSRGR